MKKQPICPAVVDVRCTAMVALLVLFGAALGAAHVRVAAAEVYCLLPGGAWVAFLVGVCWLYSRLNAMGVWVWDQYVQLRDIIRPPTAIPATSAAIAYPELPRKQRMSRHVWAVLVAAVALGGVAEAGKCMSSVRSSIASRPAQIAVMPPVLLTVYGASQYVWRREKRLNCPKANMLRLCTALQQDRMQLGTRLCLRGHWSPCLLDSELPLYIPGLAEETILQ